jgi:MFS family permease
MFTRFLPFWIFMIFFKFAGALHYSLVSPFGDKLLPLWLVGLLMGGGSVVQFLLDVPAGHIMDRFGYRRFLLITTVIFAGAAIAYMFGLTRTTYIVSLIISTFGWLFFGPGINAYALSHADKKTAGRFMSLKDVSGSIGVVLASVALPFALLISPAHVGIILFALFVVALAGLIFAPKDVRHAMHKDTVESAHFFARRHVLSKTLAALKRLNPASSILIMQGMSAGIFYGAVWFTVPLVIESQSSSGILGLGLAVFDFSVIILGYVLGRLADRVNRRLLVFAGLLVFAVSAAFSGLDFGWLFLIFGFMTTGGDEMSGLSLWAWLHSLDKDHASDGAVSGVINLFEDSGWAIGPIMAGFVYPTFGPTMTLIIAALPIFLTWIVYTFMIHEHAPHALKHSELPLRPHKKRHRE